MKNPFKAAGSAVSGMWAGAASSDVAPVPAKVGVVLLAPIVAPVAFVAALFQKAEVKASTLRGLLVLASLAGLASAMPVRVLSQGMEKLSPLSGKQLESCYVFYSTAKSDLDQAGGNATEPEAAAIHRLRRELESTLAAVSLGRADVEDSARTSPEEISIACSPAATEPLRKLLDGYRGRLILSPAQQSARDAAVRLARLQTTLAAAAQAAPH